MQAMLSLVHRDLTRTFVQQRLKKQQADQQELMHLGEAKQTPLLQWSNSEEPRPHRYAPVGSHDEPDSLAASRGAEADSLPPQWVDFSDKARDELQEIKAQLIKLTRVQQKRLLRPFDVGDRSEREIQALTGSIGNLIRSCERSILQVRTVDEGKDSSANNELRHFVQRSLAAQLQRVSGQVCKAQQDYLQEVRRRQLQEQLQQQQDSYDVESARPNNGDDVGSAVRTEWLQKQEEMEETAAIRSSEISRIAVAVTELHQIFNDMSNLVIEQGSILDCIDYNIERIYQKVDDGRVQMVEAAQKKKEDNSMVMKWFIGWAVADLIMLLALLVKYQRRYGLINVVKFFCIFLCIISVLNVGCVWYVSIRRPQWLSAEYWFNRCLALTPTAMWRMTSCCIRCPCAMRFLRLLI